MTLKQVLSQSGKFFLNKDASYIGYLIQVAAKAKGITWEKIEETITVNDYPEDFVDDMKTIVSEYYNRKKEVTKKVMLEMTTVKVQTEKPLPIKKERKRIPVKN